MKDWISVDDFLPELTQQVNVWIPENDRVLPCTFMYNTFEIYSIMCKEWVQPHGKITHWMPLPQPPKEQ